MRLFAIMLAVSAVAPAAEYRRFTLSGFERISLQSTLHAIERQVTPETRGGPVVQREVHSLYYRESDVLYIRTDVWRAMVERSKRRMGQSRLPRCRWYSNCGELR